MLCPATETVEERKKTLSAARSAATHTADRFGSGDENLARSQVTKRVFVVWSGWEIDEMDGKVPQPLGGAAPQGATARDVAAQPVVEIDSAPAEYSLPPLVGFTSGATSTLNEIVRRYVGDLVTRARGYANTERQPGIPVEVTQGHVKTAERSLAGHPLRRSGWSLLLQVGEYAAAGFVGAGASNLSRTAGIVTFAVALVLGGTFLAVRSTVVDRQ
jgi:hypothetical protein